MPITCSTLAQYTILDYRSTLRKDPGERQRGTHHISTYGLCNFVSFSAKLFTSFRLMFAVTPHLVARLVDITITSVDAEAIVTCRQRDH